MKKSRQNYREIRVQDDNIREHFYGKYKRKISVTFRNLLQISKQRK